MRKEKEISIVIREQCMEDWQGMQPNGEGKFCASCQKQVTDFTSMTDTQILAFLSKSGNTTSCGRFSSTQLSRSFEAQPAANAAHSGIYSRTAAWFMMLQTLSVSAFAQQVKKTHKNVSHHAVNNKGKAPAPPLIKGLIIDNDAQVPIPGIDVFIKGTAYCGTTDKNGRFIIDIPDSLKGATVTLTQNVYHALMSDSNHYYIEDVTIDTAITNKEIVMTRFYVEHLPEHTIYMPENVRNSYFKTGGYTTVVTYKRVNLVKQICRFLWHKISKPFRHRQENG